MINDFDEILEKSTVLQVADFIKNGEVNGDIADYTIDSFNAINKVEHLIKAKLNTGDADEVIDAVNSLIFLAENSSFHRGFRAGTKLLKELLQI